MLQKRNQCWIAFNLTLDFFRFLVQQQESEGLAVSAPLLKSLGRYSNFWGGMDERFYYRRTEEYGPILDRKETECFEVPMVHSCVMVDMDRKESRGLTFVPDELEGKYHCSVSNDLPNQVL